MTREETVDILEHFLDSFYEFPDWHVLSEKDTEAIETLIKSAKEDKKWLADNHKKIFNNGWDEGFGAGRDSMEEDMMKDAIETKITCDDNSRFPIIKYQLPLTYDCKIGDKVKLIIIKED